MNIYIDESGSFVSAPEEGCWNCVAAYMSPETNSRPAKEALKQWKRDARASFKEEVKIGRTDENIYFDFLRRLVRLDGVLFAVATDSFFNTRKMIRHHQKMQVEGILKNLLRIKHQGGKDAVSLLAKQIGGLSPQLYAQLQCQVRLIDDVLRRGVLYFVQRRPNCLGKFRWRIDQKNSSKPTFEQAFEKFTPGLLQAISIDEPSLALRGANYSAFSRFLYDEGEEPEYLKKDYGVDISPDSAIDLGKLFREDLRFEDSKLSWGVQIADLLASGVRRCLRGGFEDNNLAAQLIGGLTLENEKSKEPIKLLGLSEGKIEVGTDAWNAMNNIRKNARPMLRC